MDGEECTSRRELLAYSAGLAGAALLAPATALAATSAKAHGSDARTVRRLLSIELLMLYTYRHVIVSPLLSAQTRRALAPMRANEEAHVRVLGARLRALGGSAPAPPASLSDADKRLAHRDVSGRLGQLKSAKDALRLVLAVERVTVGAYYVALTRLEQPALITLAAEIMANDAQHEAMVGELLYNGKVDQAVPYGLVQGVQ
jgi:ferritin-like protein